MKIQLLSVGKNHEPNFKDGIDDFTKRISKYFPVKWLIVAPPKNAGAFSEQELKRKEGEYILEYVGKEDYVIVLDEKGNQLSSQQLARFIQARANESEKKIIFLIGGAFGIDDIVLKRCNFKWSLSQLTFPHQLVRLILAEQLYRACSILRNEKYHHS